MFSSSLKPGAHSVTVVTSGQAIPRTALSLAVDMFLHLLNCTLLLAGGEGEMERGGGVYGVVCVLCETRKGNRNVRFVIQNYTIRQVELFVCRRIGCTL